MASSVLSSAPVAGAWELLSSTFKQLTTAPEKSVEELEAELEEFRAAMGEELEQLKTKEEKCVGMGRKAGAGVKARLAR